MIQLADGFLLLELGILGVDQVVHHLFQQECRGTDGILGTDGNPAGSIQIEIPWDFQLLGQGQNFGFIDGSGQHLTAHDAAHHLAAVQHDVKAEIHEAGVAVVYAVALAVAFDAAAFALFGHAGILGAEVREADGAGDILPVRIQTDGGHVAGLGPGLHNLYDLIYIYNLSDVHTMLPCAP